jgi:hypothetical protein
MRALAFRLMPAKSWSGVDGVLLNTAVSRALDPVRMAGAFAQAIRSGRSAFLGGPMTVQEMAVSSTPEIGRPFAFHSSRVPHAPQQTPDAESGETLKQWST